jgi:hypothetical protein
MFGRRHSVKPELSLLSCGRRNAWGRDHGPQAHPISQSVMQCAGLPVCRFNSLLQRPIGVCDTTPSFVGRNTRIFSKRYFGVRNRSLKLYFQILLWALLEIWGGLDRRPQPLSSRPPSGTSPKPTVCRGWNSKRKKSWNAPATRSRHSPAGTRPSGVSSTKIEPDDGSYIFESSFTSVVLRRHPLRRFAITAPAGSVNETSSRTTRDVPGYALCGKAARTSTAFAVGT